MVLFRLSKVAQGESGDLTKRTVHRCVTQMVPGEQIVIRCPIPQPVGRPL
jgi:hypothetical protein